jgi:actin-like ATPase involved in cell morphogenesis
LSLLFKSREKPKQAFREWVQRILSNIVLYLNAISPRYFDDAARATGGGSSQVIDMNIGFEFIFDRSESSQVDKLTFKDLASEQLGMSLTKVEMVFKILSYTLQRQ